MDKMLALGIVLSAKDMFSPVLSKLNGGIGDVLKNTDAMAAKKIDLNQKLDKATLSADGLDRQIKEIDDELKTLNAKKIKLDEQFKSGEISAEKFGAELTKIERKKSLLDSKKLRLSDELDATTQSAKKLEDELNKIDKAARFEKIGKALNDVSKNASLAGTALMGVSVASRGAAETVIKSYVDFEDAQIQLKNTLMKSDGSVSPFFKAISDEATKLGSALPGTTADFFKMASTLKSLGVEEKSIVGGALKSAAYLGSVLKIPYEEAAEATAKFKQAMGITDDELLNFIDDIQRMSHMGVKVGEMSFAFSKVGATMKGLGLSGLKAARDVEPLIGMLIKGGASGETVGTNLGQMMNNAVKFKGSKGDKELKKQGVSLNFTDDKGNFKGVTNMVKELEKLKKIKGDAARISAIEAIFGTGEAAGMAKTLMNEGTAGLEKFNNEMKAQADINQRAAEASKGLGNMWEAMTGSLTNLYGIIGGSLAPEMKGMTDWFGRATNAMTDFAEKHPAITKFVGAAVLGLTVVTGVLGALGVAVGAAAFGFKALGVWTALSTVATWAGVAAQTAFNLVFAASPIGMFIRGLLVVVAVGKILYNRFKPFADLVDKIVSGVGSFFGMSPEPVKKPANNQNQTRKPVTIPVQNPTAVPVKHTVTIPANKPNYAPASAPTQKPVTIPAPKPTASAPAQTRTNRTVAMPTHKAASNNTTVNVTINNPKFDSKEQESAMKKQIVKEVTAAIIKTQSDRKDRSYA